MKATRLAPITVILALAMVALPAAAEHRTPRRDDYGLETLARRLVVATDALRTHVARGATGRHHLRHPALRTVARLDRDAQRFERHLRLEGVFDRDTRVAFHRLEASYRHANETLPVAHARRGIRRDFARIAALIAQVDNRLARVARHHHDRRIDRRHDARRHRDHEDRRYGFLTRSDRGWQLGWPQHH